MHSIRDAVQINGRASAVYEALTQQEGFRGWWNKACEVTEKTGGEAKMHFIKEGRPVNMNFRIDEMHPNSHVRWTCVANDAPDWIGTTLDWKCTQEGAAVAVAFEHAGWKEPPAEMVSQSWRHFLGSLKSYVETGSGQPW